MNPEIKMDLKDLTIRQLATRIANDAIQLATIQGQFELLKNQKEVEEHGEKLIEPTDKETT